MCTKHEGVRTFFLAFPELFFDNVLKNEMGNVEISTRNFILNKKLIDDSSFLVN